MTEFRRYITRAQYGQHIPVLLCLYQSAVEKLSQEAKKQLRLQEPTLRVESMDEYRRRFYERPVYLGVHLQYVTSAKRVSTHE